MKIGKNNAAAKGGRWDQAARDSLARPKICFFLPTNICQHFRRHWFAIVSKNGGFEIEFASKALLKLLYPEEQKHHGCEEKEFSLSDDNAPINEQFETDILVFVETFPCIFSPYLSPHGYRGRKWKFSL